MSRLLLFGSASGSVQWPSSSLGLQRLPGRSDSSVPSSYSRRSCLVGHLLPWASYSLASLLLPWSSYSLPGHLVPWSSYSLASILLPWVSYSRSSLPLPWASYSLLGHLLPWTSHSLYSPSPSLCKSWTSLERHRCVWLVCFLC